MVPALSRAYPAGHQAVSLVLSSRVHRLPNWKKVKALSMAPHVIFAVSPALTLNAGFSKQALIFPLQVAGGLCGGRALGPDRQGSSHVSALYELWGWTSDELQKSSKL